MSDLTKIIDTLQELERMHKLNFEFLEQLTVFSQWIIEQKIEVPNKEKFLSLLHKTEALMNEMGTSNSLKTIQYRKLTNKSLHEHKNNEDFTEPSSIREKKGHW